MNVFTYVFVRSILKLYKCIAYIRIKTHRLLFNEAQRGSLPTFKLSGSNMLVLTCQVFLRESYYIHVYHKKTGNQIWSKSCLKPRISDDWSRPVTAPSIGMTKYFKASTKYKLIFCLTDLLNFSDFFRFATISIDQT